MSQQPGRSGQLVCPSCGKEHEAGERFCADCGMPLTHSEQEHPDALVSEVHRRARMVKPQLSEGRLVRVAFAHNQAEGEFIQGLLLEQGVPSVLRRSAGFDVPDFLAAGPRDVLVPQSGVTTARQVLLEAELISAEPAPRLVSPVRLLAALLAALAVGALVVWAIAQLS